MYIDEYEDNGFGKKKTFLKKIAKPLRKIGAAHAGVFLAPVAAFKPKALKYVGIKSKKSQKLARKVGKGTLITAAAVGAAVVAAPMVGAAVGKAGSATMGGFKWLQGKLVGAPASALAKLKEGGIDPAVATPEQVIEAGLDSGSLQPETVSEAQDLIEKKKPSISPMMIGTIAALGIGAAILAQKE